MKNSNESLKNQLEIVKEELEVAKDLNDHFTNEIRQYFGGEKDSIELDRLKKEVKELQKEKEEMRMKITKYQNHITTLKSEFKLKIEELYRKVKKERWVEWMLKKRKACRIDLGKIVRNRQTAW